MTGFARAREAAENNGGSGAEEGTSCIRGRAEGDSVRPEVAFEAVLHAADCNRP